MSNDIDGNTLPQLRLTVASVVFFKCDHAQDIIVGSKDTDVIGAGDIATCEMCHTKRLVREVTNYRKENIRV